MADKFSNRSAGIEREADAAGGFKPHKTGILGKIEQKIDALMGHKESTDSRQDMLHGSGSGASGVPTTSGTGMTSSSHHSSTGTGSSSLADKIQNVIVGPPGSAPSDDGVTDPKGPAYVDKQSTHGTGATSTGMTGHGATGHGMSSSTGMGTGMSSSTGMSSGTGSTSLGHGSHDTTPMTADQTSSEFSAGGTGGSTALPSTGGSSSMSQDMPVERTMVAEKVPVHDEFDSTSTPSRTF